jgi:mRNA interferase RelE/StbE
MSEAFRSRSMSYRLEFLPSALKEWRKLGATIREQFVKKLKERLEQPHIPSDALHGMARHYKIKLRQAGYRLVYRVDDDVIPMIVVAVRRRERSEVCRAAKQR